MARLSRLYLTGCSHYIIQRGNNRNLHFLRERLSVLFAAVESLGGAIECGGLFFCIDYQ